MLYIVTVALLHFMTASKLH